MPGIGTTIQHYFAPKVTADTVIRLTKANGLTNATVVGPQSSSAKVTIGIMSALTGVITLPVFMKLYDAIQAFFAPEKLHRLALLGCLTANAEIDENVFGPDTRSITVLLGEENEPDTMLHFIERKKTDGSGATELFISDYTGEEKPCFEKFSTLEEVREFYKADLLENREGIYSENLSKGEFLSYTLGMVLYRYGSVQFDKYDLLNFEKFFNVMPGTTKLEELQNPALKLNFTSNANKIGGELLFVHSMMMRCTNLNDWDRGSTDYLLEMFTHGLSDGLLSIYQRIFTEEVLGKYAALAGTIFSLCHQFSGEHNQIWLKGKSLDTFMERVTYVRSMEDAIANFTKEFSLSGDTKVTLQNYSLHYPLERNGEEEKPRLEITIAGKIQSIARFTIDNEVTRECILKERDMHRKNYAALLET